MMFSTLNPAAAGICIWCILVFIFGGDDSPTPTPPTPTPTEIVMELEAVKTSLAQAEKMIGVKPPTKARQKHILTRPVFGREDTIYFKN